MDVDSGKELLQTMANMQKELLGVPKNEYAVTVDFAKISIKIQYSIRVTLNLNQIVPLLN